MISYAIYHILGIGRNGYRELIGMYVSDNEDARFYQSILTDIRNRGVQDILIACIDNLKGFPEAIANIFPDPDINIPIATQNSIA